MSEKSCDQWGKWFEDGDFISKENWANYVAYDRSNDTWEHYGYLAATEGIVDKLKQALTVDDSSKFRALITQLTDNRQELVVYGYQLIDRQTKAVQHQPSPKQK